VHDFCEYARLPPEQADVYANLEALTCRIRACVDRLDFFGANYQANRQDLAICLRAWRMTLDDLAWRALWDCWKETSGAAEHYAKQLLWNAGIETDDEREDFTLRRCQKGHAQWSLVRRHIHQFLGDWLTASKPASGEKAPQRRRRKEPERRALGVQAIVLIADGASVSEVADRLDVPRNTLRGMPGVEQAIQLAAQGRQDERKRQEEERERERKRRFTSE
jgi:hypothetical protein